MDQLRGLITPPETEDRGNKKAIMVIGGIVFLVLVGLLLLQVKGKKRDRRVKEIQDRPVAARELDNKQEAPRQDLRYKSSYSGLALDAPAKEPTLPLLERPTTPPAADLAKAPGEQVDLTPRVPPPPPQAPAGLPAPPPPQEPARAHRGADARRTHGPARKATADKKRVHWLEEDTKVAIEKPPFPVKETTQQEQAGNSLFPKAVWAIPADPTKTLYASQMLKGIVLHDINTDLPGELRVLVTEQVEDRWGQGNVLVPQWSILLGEQKGGLRYGQERLDTSFRGMEFPNGTVVKFESKAGDARGAAGIPLNVNRHLPELILGVGLTAAMNIGARAPFGNPQGYQQSLPQEFSHAAQGINQAGQQVIARELQRNPTGSSGMATVFIFFKDNISFQTPAVVVTQ